MNNFFKSESFITFLIRLFFSIISFLIISWLVEGGFWLHFFLSTPTFYILNTNFEKQIKEILLPITQSYDNHLNDLYDKSIKLESHISDLENKVEQLEFKLDDLENNR